MLISYKQVEKKDSDTMKNEIFATLRQKRKRKSAAHSGTFGCQTNGRPLRSQKILYFPNTHIVIIFLVILHFINL